MKIARGMRSSAESICLSRMPCRRSAMISAILPCSMASMGSPSGSFPSPSPGCLLIGPSCLLQSGDQRGARLLVSEVHVKRRHRNEAVIDGAQIRSLGRIARNTFKAEPVIGVGARVDALLDRDERLIALTLRRHLHALDARSEEHTSELQYQ